MIFMCLNEFIEKVGQPVTNIDIMIVKTDLK